MRSPNVAYADIVRARNVLAGFALHTHLVPSGVLSRQTGGEVYLKTENMQRTGSFKLRGAYNKIQALSDDEKCRGVIAASAGNHAQGVAVAAHAAGIKSIVVMPEIAPLSKITAARGYGAEVILAGQTYDEASKRAHELQVEYGATLVHPFDDPLVIAGQGTVGLEVLDDMPDVDTLLVPVGGGGLIAGVATAIKQHHRGVKVVGVQASGASACAVSFRRGRLQSSPAVTTIADGIAVKRPGALPFALIRNLVDDIVTVEDEDISRAIVLLLERSKLLVEGAGAVGVAALMAASVNFSGKKVVAILSGGNVDINAVAKTIEHGLTNAGRYLVIRTLLPDEPGHLFRLLQVMAEQGVNVLNIDHYRAGFNLSLSQAQVMVTIETRDFRHGEEIIATLTGAGFHSERAT